jgi:DNA-binding protein Fis
MCSNLFDFENRLTNDTCAQESKESGNKHILNYNTYNFYGDCDNAKLKKLAADCPNLHFRNGYGFTSSCTVDTDSAMRFAVQTHGPERRQMNTRTFTAVPDMSRGCAAPDVESYLLNGQDTNLIRECKHSAEMDYNRFTPLLDCVQDYVKGYSERNYFPVGIDSRETMRKYMRKCE